MKSVGGIATYIPVILFWLCCGLSAAHAAKLPEELILNTQYEFPPYVIHNKDGSVGGHSIEVVQCVAEKLGMALTILRYPWPRAQQQVRDGYGHGFFPASRNQFRDSFATLSDPVSPQRWYWYLPQDSTLDVHSPDFRNNAHVGARLGSNMHNWLKNNHYNLTYYTSNWSTLVTALVNRRVEAILAVDTTTDPILAARKLSQAYRKELCLDMPLGVYFGTSFIAQYPDILPLFNAQLPACRRPLNDHTSNTDSN